MNNDQTRPKVRAGNSKKHNFLEATGSEKPTSPNPAALCSLVFTPPAPPLERERERERDRERQRKRETETETERERDSEHGHTKFLNQTLSLSTNIWKVIFLTTRKGEIVNLRHPSKMAFPGKEAAQFIQDIIFAPIYKMIINSS